MKRPYVNLALLQVDIENVFNGATADKTHNDWLQPAPYMLLVKEEAAERVLKGEMPSDTCALICGLTSGTDSIGDPIYFYTYDLSTMLTHELREDSIAEQLDLLLVPVTVTTATTSSSTSVISSVKESQTLSATVIRSAQNGLNLKLVYSGF